MDLAPPPADAPTQPPPLGDGDDGTERLLGGVAGLLADRLGVEALWVRIAFVLLALVGGIGLILYGALWLAFIVGADPDRRWARLAGGAVLIVGLPLVLTSGFNFFSGPVAVLALLLGLAVALWQPQRLTGPPATAPVAAPGVVAASSGSGEPGAGRAPRRLPRLPKRAERPPSIVGRLALGIAVVVAAVGALIDEANGGRLHPEQWLGAAAIVCGVGLAVAAFAGHARWLIVPAALFAGAGFVAGEAARIGIEPTALVGDEHIWVGDGASGELREHVVIGSVDVVIESRPSVPVTVDARTAVGEVRVVAREDVTVLVDAEVGSGDIRVERVDRPDGSYALGPEGPPDVVVVARVGRGNIDVQQWDRPIFERPVRPAPPAAPAIGEEVIGQQLIADGVLLVSGGRFVLADGEAVIDADDTVLSGPTDVRDRVTVISTSYGEFQLLPGGLLLTPSGEVVDLRAVRGELTDESATTTVPGDAPTGSPLPATTVPGG